MGLLLRLDLQLETRGSSTTIVSPAVLPTHRHLRTSQPTWIIVSGISAITQFVLEDLAPNGLPQECRAPLIRLVTFAAVERLDWSFRAWRTMALEHGGGVADTASYQRYASRCWNPINDWQGQSSPAGLSTARRPERQYPVRAFSNGPSSSTALPEGAQGVGGRVGEEVAREFPETASSQPPCSDLLT